MPTSALHGVDVARDGVPAAAWEDFAGDYLGIQWADGDWTISDRRAGGCMASGTAAAPSTRQVAWQVQATLSSIELPCFYCTRPSRGITHRRALS